MPTSGEPADERASDRLVAELSSWLAGHRTTDQLRAVVEGVPLDELEPGEQEAVDELRDVLDAGRPRPQLEVAVREAMEALALGE